MLAMQYRLNEDFVASDVVRWYNKASLGDTMVIALTSHPSGSTAVPTRTCIGGLKAGEA
jgi:hypothetical protein